MLRQLYSYVRQVLLLAADVQKLKTEVKELRQEVKEMAELMRAWRSEQQRERDRAESDWKILLLEIENRFLRHERGLPPGKRLEDE